MEQTQDGTGTTERAVTVTEFLEARIAEDEGRAQDAFYDGQQWIPEEEAVVAADHDLEPILYLDRKRDAIHAAKWSPARVLAECAAKRAVVGRYEEFYATRRANWMNPNYAGAMEELKWALQALAAVYADHADYRQEWALG